MQRKRALLYIIHMIFEGGEKKMLKKFFILSLVIVSLFFTPYCFAGVLDKLKELKDVEEVKKENKILKQENADLKQQLANAKKISYQNIAQPKYKTIVSGANNYLVDGDRSGINVVPEWYELDFHYSRIIDKVIVYLTPTEKVIAFDLSFYYYDPVSQKWNSLKTINNEGKNIITLTFTPLNTSKLKIYPTTKSSNLPIAEIEVFGWVIEE